MRSWTHSSRGTTTSPPSSQAKLRALSVMPATWSGFSRPGATHQPSGRSGGRSRQGSGNDREGVGVAPASGASDMGHTKLERLDDLLRQDPQRAKIEILKRLGGELGDRAAAVHRWRAPGRDQRPCKCESQADRRTPATGEILSSASRSAGVFPARAGWRRRWLYSCPHARSLRTSSGGVVKVTRR
jgi:hypothetical protein